MLTFNFMCADHNKLQNIVVLLLLCSVYGWLHFYNWHLKAEPHCVDIIIIIVVVHQMKPHLPFIVDLLEIIKATPEQHDIEFFLFDFFTPCMYYMCIYMKTFNVSRTAMLTNRIWSVIWYLT